MQFLILTIIVAIIGGLIGIYLKIPAGAMLGALIFVALINIQWDVGYMPDSIGVAARIISGAAIGARITKKDIMSIKNVLLSSVILVASFVVFIPAIGLSIYKISSLDITTSLFSSTPGGMTDMALVADDLGADTPKVLLMQLLRLLSVLCFMPIITKLIGKRYSRPAMNNKSNDFLGITDVISHKFGTISGTISCTNDALPNQTNAIQAKTEALPNKANAASPMGANWLKSNQTRFILTIIAGSIGGILGIMLSLPAGSMIGSMLAVAALNISTGTAFVPKKASLVLQIAVGAMMGSDITMQDVIGLKEIALPGVILVFGLFLLNLFIGFMIHKFSKLDLVTAMLASAPGGVTEMTLVADDMGADTPKVSILQLLRLISVIIIFPFLLRFLCRFL